MDIQLSKIKKKKALKFFYKLVRDVVYEIADLATTDTFTNERDI